MTNALHPCEEHCGTKGDLVPGELAPGFTSEDKAERDEGLRNLVPGGEAKVRDKQTKGSRQ